MTQDEIYAALSTSATLAKIHDMAKMINVDIQNTDDVRGAFAASGILMITELDQSRIVFHSDLNRAALLRLLGVVPITCWAAPENRHNR